jgi:hypothetical protein
MKPQMRLEQILLVWVTSPNAMVASRRLGISRRTLYYRLEKASLMELRDAYAQLQVDTHAQLAQWQGEYLRSLHETEALLVDLTQQVETLRLQQAEVERQRAALVRENQALRRELLRSLTMQIEQQASGHHPIDDPYAVLHLTRDAPPEVVVAAYRALSKRDHPDMDGSDAAMQRLNWARDMIVQRNGRMP